MPKNDKIIKGGFEKIMSAPAGSIHYYLVKTTNEGNVFSDFKKIIDYLLTFVGDLEINKKNEGEVEIAYTETPLKATLKTHTPPKTTDAPYLFQIDLTCQRNDNISVNLLKNVTKNIGYRIFNPQTQAYLVNDPNALDLTTVDLDKNISKIFNRYQLWPFLQYRETLVFFAKDKEGKIHLVNRHLLEFLLREPQKRVYPQAFSIIVAPDIGRFIALFDRGLIPLSFYHYRQLKNQKVINLSGFNLEKLPQKTIFNLIYFVFDRIRQSFNQTEISGLPQTIQITKDSSVINKLEKTIKTSSFKKYLAVKIAQDVDYIKQGKELVPCLRTSIFLDN